MNKVIRYYKIVLNHDVQDYAYGEHFLYKKGTTPDDEWERVTGEALINFAKYGPIKIIHGHGVYTYFTYPDDFDTYEVTEEITTTEKKILEGRNKIGTLGKSR